MKILCNKNDLLQGINTAAKAVSSKTTMEILQCILIEAFNNSIRLTANDTELGIETIVEGSVIEPGKIALEARLFSEMIKRLPDNEVSIITEEHGKTEIDCEKVHFTIMGKKGDDFTRLPEIEKMNRITMSQFDLKEVIRQTIFSVSDNENNKLMTGELFKIDGRKLSVTSLDGHRIAARNVELGEEYPAQEVIVPGKTLQEISKILPGEAEDMINLYITDKHILFEFASTRVVSRLLEGKFYNISQMLSSDYETKVVINKMELLRCLDRSTLFVKESDRKPVIFQIDNNELSLKIATPIGSLDDQIPVSKEGKDLTIGFNPRFFVDALRVIDEEEVTLYMINSIAPCIIRDEEGKYLYLILPINVNNSGY